MSIDLETILNYYHKQMGLTPHSVHVHVVYLYWKYIVEKKHLHFPHLFVQLKYIIISNVSRLNGLSIRS